MKRIFDITLAAISVVGFSPLFLLISIAIKFDSPSGRILYRSQRAGRHGKAFRLLKFRTMVAEADKMGGPSTPDDDPRITRIGKPLRKYKLDELPQLWNILRGDMSFAGPRPEVPQYAALLKDEEKLILSVRPGLTDWASLWNHDEGATLAGCDDPERTYLEEIRPKKLALQLEYVRKHTFTGDLIILLRTFAAIAFRASRLWSISSEGQSFSHGSQSE
jgi:lipopolysaccharide/colanic/teichoic acid biosynthesis glycosyltransferase